jgi:hypothetical protein
LLEGTGMFNAREAAPLGERAVNPAKENSENTTDV